MDIGHGCCEFKLAMPASLQPAVLINLVIKTAYDFCSVTHCQFSWYSIFNQPRFLTDQSAGFFCFLSLNDHGKRETLVVELNKSTAVDIMIELLQPGDNDPVAAHAGNDFRH